ncbi:uncharacterized protein A4U43_C01F16290 [Asparagus officinalis]|uniref:Uncharacterized protein n=1 Tax=Asparagus officinalis TaxID=4686 RepID=A0A5P1FQL4_ASPOF|nr:uncharacterized protein A4U43_C01F16290 [Asparagus officinalis]
MASPPPLDFRTPLGSLLMSSLSPMNQRAAATTELMLAGDESRFMGQSRIDRSDKLDAAIMASPPPPPPGFRTPSGSLPMSPLSPMNQR